MARVKGGRFLPYLFIEGVSSPHLHAHYSPSMSHHECFIRWGSDPIFGEKIGNGPICTNMNISFHGDPLAKNGFWDFCRAVCPLWEDKGGVSSDPLFLLENGFWWGPWRSCSCGERGVYFSRQIGSVEGWWWCEKAEGQYFRWDGKCPTLSQMSLTPSAHMWMTNVILMSCVVSWMNFPGDTRIIYRALCVNCPSQEGTEETIGTREETEETPESQLDRLGPPLG